MQKEECGKMHEIIGDQILVNQALREGIQEYWLEHGITHVLPDESMRSVEKKAAPQKKLVPWSEGTWRLLEDELIAIGDQWAPLSSPYRWRPVNDSVGKTTSRYKNSRFRRLTIETDQKDIRAPGQDTGSNLVGRRCWLWNDGAFRAFEGNVSHFREGKYCISGTWFNHARISSMGEPLLRPHHQYRDAGLALVRCKCRVWSEDSVNFNPDEAPTALVSRYLDGVYTTSTGTTYPHAQPIGSEPEPLPPMLLPVVRGEIPGHNGETVVGKSCYVWNSSPYSRPRGIENAVIMTVTSFSSNSHPYRTPENRHQYARPIEFGHPDVAQRHPNMRHIGEYCKLIRSDDTFKFGVVTEESAIDVECGGERFAMAAIVDTSSLVGKRAFCWNSNRDDAVSGVVIAANDGVFRTKFGLYSNAAFDVTNQDPEEDSGDATVGINCYVWDERFSSTRIGVIEAFGDEGYSTTINGDLRHFKHARPVSLGVR